MTTLTSRTAQTDTATIADHEAQQVERANASFQLQQRNEGVTEIVEMPNRGHALTVDSGWREVADTSLAFMKRFV